MMQQNAHRQDILERYGTAGHSTRSRNNGLQWEGIGKHYRDDNQVHRAILQLPTTTAIEAQRAETGASSSKAQDAKMNLIFTKNALLENRNNLRESLLLEYEEKSAWIKNLKFCLWKTKFKQSTPAEIKH